MWNAWLDLALGSRCLVCFEGGRVLCSACAEALPDRGFQVGPGPETNELAPTFVVGHYVDPLKTLLLAHKERGVYGLAAPLGRLLAVAIAAAGLPDAEIHLIAVPSSPSSVRRRGHDPVARMVRAAAREMKQRGTRAVATPLLRQRHRIADQAGLDAAERVRNLQEGLRVEPGAHRRLAGRAVLAVLCDDIITTGATAREAQRALGEVGIKVAAFAAVLATEKRGQGGPLLG